MFSTLAKPIMISKFTNTDAISHDIIVLFLPIILGHALTLRVLTIECGFVVFIVLERTGMIDKRNMMLKCRSHGALRCCQ